MCNYHIRLKVWIFYTFKSIKKLSIKMTYSLTVKVFLPEKKVKETSVNNKRLILQNINIKLFQIVNTSIYNFARRDS